MTAFVSQDYPKALQLLTPLADQGNAIAQNNLGIMYHFGRGVPQDQAEAVKWYRRAADQGHTGAQFSLAVMLESGEGTPQDLVQARMWLELARAGGMAGAAELSELVGRKLTPAQIAEAQHMATAWKSKQATQ